MVVEKSRNLWVQKAMVNTTAFLCSLGMTGVVYPIEKIVLEQPFVFSAKEIKKGSFVSRVSISQGKTQVIAELSKDNIIESVKKTLVGQVVFNGIAVASGVHYKGEAPVEKSRIDIFSSVQFGEDGTCQLLFRTHNRNHHGLGDSPHRVIDRGNIHFLRDIFPNFRFQVEVQINKKDIITKVSVVNRQYAPEKVAEKRSPIASDKEYREMCLAAFGYWLLKSHHSTGEFSAQIKQFNLVLNIHGTVDMSLDTSERYNNIASTCVEGRCKQQGPSYMYSRPPLVLCCGHHFCKQHNKISVGYYPLLFAYISSRDAVRIRLAHIHIKNLINVVGTISFNPLLEVEHQQARVFVEIDEIKALDGATQFLEQSGFNRLVHDQGYEMKQQDRQQKKKNPVKKKLQQSAQMFSEDDRFTNLFKHHSIPTRAARQGLPNTAYTESKTVPPQHMLYMNLDNYPLPPNLTDSTVLNPTYVHGESQNDSPRGIGFGDNQINYSVEGMVDLLEPQPMPVFVPVPPYYVQSGVLSENCSYQPYQPCQHNLDPGGMALPLPHPSGLWGLSPEVLSTGPHVPDQPIVEPMGNTTYQYHLPAPSLWIPKDYGHPYGEPSPWKPGASH